MNYENAKHKKFSKKKFSYQKIENSITKHGNHKAPTTHNQFRKTTSKQHTQFSFQKTGNKKSATEKVALYTLY